MSAVKFFYQLIRIKWNPRYVIKNPAKDKQSEALIASLSNVEQGGTAFFGDSIVSNWNLSAYFCPPVYNLGIGGDDTHRALRRFFDTAAPLRPSSVVLHIGDNDLKYGYPAAVAADNLAKLIDMAKSIPSARHIIVDSAPPVNRSFGNMPGLCTNKKVNRLNRLFEDVCKKKGVVFVNSNAVLKDGRGNLRADWTTDGMHLTEEGYRAVSSLIAAALE